MHLLATGFVGDSSGSIAAANAVLLRGLLDRGHCIRFFSKPSFVDPRTACISDEQSSRLDLVDCTNHRTDALRRRMAPTGGGLLGHVFGRIDSFQYNRGLGNAFQSAKIGDVDVWFGDWARGKSKRPVVSFVQGAPGTDARSIFNHRRLIESLAGKRTWLKLAAFATWRLNFGLPPFHNTDTIVLGSSWSRQCLIGQYKIPAERVFAMPYPIDLGMFKPASPKRSREGALKLLWLGRFVPRKRLDLLLQGLKAAIESGYDVEAWIVGQSGFVPGYEKLLDSFAYPDRIRRWDKVPRVEVPGMLNAVDVMVQPSEEEDFGSSVAEALACGIPAIVGATNGTGDYVCKRSIQMKDYSVEAMASAIVAMAEAKRKGELSETGPSRLVAEQWFAPQKVVDRFEAILQGALQCE